VRFGGARSLLSEVVIVGVDRAAELGCLNQALPAHLVRLVERDVQLEEAGVRLGERRIAHAVHQAQLVTALALHIHRQSAATPDELEIARTLLC